jgi:hypothetical protein
MKCAEQPGIVLLEAFEPDMWFVGTDVVAWKHENSTQENGTRKSTFAPLILP